ncbi:MAG: hypothetical protein K2P51_07440 [Rhabdochlamydiaceae bacterium]|nr:hypothetical protein [Rhabdochlamydiaceae bacterium]
MASFASCGSISLEQFQNFKQTYQEYKELITRPISLTFGTCLDLYERSEESYQSLKFQGKALQALFSDPSSRNYLLITRILSNCKCIHKREKAELEMILPPSLKPYPSFCGYRKQWNQDRVERLYVLKAKWKMLYAKVVRERAARGDYLVKVRRKYGEKCDQNVERWLIKWDHEDRECRRKYEVALENYLSHFSLLEQQYNAEVKLVEDSGDTARKVSRLNKTYKKKLDRLAWVLREKKEALRTVEQADKAFFKNVMRFFDTALQLPYGPTCLADHIVTVEYLYSWIKKKPIMNFHKIYPLNILVIQMNSDLGEQIPAD